MPGYMIHLAEAGRILELLEEKGIFAAEEGRRRFLLGCLLPDTRRKKAKAGSHFWNRDQLWKLALGPDMDLFDGKYPVSPKDPGLLGYRVHLELDHRYVEEFWPRVVEFLDEEGFVQEREDRIRWARLRTAGQTLPVEDFFSGVYYYGDYTRMNSWLAARYGIRVPGYEPGDWASFPVEEVDPADLPKVLEELADLLSVDTAGEEEHLRVFDREELMDFIDGCARDAAEAIAAQFTGESSEYDLWTRRVPYDRMNEESPDSSYEPTGEYTYG